MTFRAGHGIHKFDHEEGGAILWLVSDAKTGESTYRAHAVEHSENRPAVEWPPVRNVLALALLKYTVVQIVIHGL